MLQETSTGVVDIWLQSHFSSSASNRKTLCVWLSRALDGVGSSRCQRIHLGSRKLAKFSENLREFRSMLPVCRAEAEFQLPSREGLVRQGSLRSVRKLLNLTRSFHEICVQAAHLANSTPRPITSKFRDDEIPSTRL